MFSRFDLGLEPFDTKGNTKNTCSFIDPQGKNLLMFKVDKVTKVLPSKVWKVTVSDPITGQTTTKSLQGLVKPLIKGYAKGYNIVPTEDTSFDKYKKYYRKNLVGNYVNVGYSSKNNPKKLGYYESQASDEKDCYIYKLSYYRSLVLCFSFQNP